MSWSSALQRFEKSWPTCKPSTKNFATRSLPGWLHPATAIARSHFWTLWPLPSPVWLASNSDGTTGCNCSWPGEETINHRSPPSLALREAWFGPMLVSSVGLVVLSPLLGGVALAILLSDGRPALFRQQRVGRHGRLFRVCKFRTMRPGADKAGPVTVGGDARVTRIGRLLRRWKLDELPQLWNVLLGHMSLVGPRPDVPGYADKLCGEERRILALRPGITGPATLAFRDEEYLLACVDDPIKYNDEVIFPAKAHLNLKYVDECSLCLDLKYILMTLAPRAKPSHPARR